MNNSRDYKSFQKKLKIVPQPTLPYMFSFWHSPNIQKLDQISPLCYFYMQFPCFHFAPRFHRCANLSNVWFYILHHITETQSVSKTENICGWLVVGYKHNIYRLHVVQSGYSGRNTGYSAPPRLSSPLHTAAQNLLKGNKYVDFTFDRLLDVFDILESGL